MKLLSKAELINRLKEIEMMGWIANARPGNVGGVGNTLEDLLGITENNLPIPNAAEWELKCQRIWNHPHGQLNLCLISYCHLMDGNMNQYPTK
jgi:hypothetical protein